jgi:hypothetical protein
MAATRRPQRQGLEHIPNCAREKDIADLRETDPLALRRALSAFPNGICRARAWPAYIAQGPDILLTQLAYGLPAVAGRLFRVFVGPILPQWGGEAIVETARKHFSPTQVRF